MNIVQVLPQLKSENEIPIVVEAALGRWFDLSAQQNECISQFFKATVCEEPEKRELNFGRLVRLLTFDEDFVLIARRQEDPVIFPDPHGLASVSRISGTAKKPITDTSRSPPNSSTWAGATTEFVYFCRKS
jgi:hypothetical protein